MFAKKRYAETTQMKKTLAMHEESSSRRKVDDVVHDGVVPAYLLDCDATTRAKVLSNTVKQKRKEKAGKWDLPLPKVRPVAEDEMFKVTRTGKRKSDQAVEEDDYESYICRTRFHQETSKDYTQEDDIHLDNIRARFASVLKRHAELTERLSRDSDKMVFERLQREFEAARASQTQEVCLDSEQWNDGLLATIRERVWLPFLIHFL
ncbi:hypothetical protein M8C21_003392 [Ambrosia artemisiifolia]|uniref:Uncharacterized protein n=1 Tax=Ambrosia artemisiifolia TaxID=4212 RepID=A0AAD5C3P9_AMBAR|nr:hypothetical protein M8C21_003392 [Ambrosia artemisiifolia]